MRVAFYKSIRPGFLGIYSRLVRWIDRGIYSHCELVFEEGLAASASYMDGGVRFKHIEFDPQHWDFVEIPDKYYKNALAWFQTEEGKPYDLKGNFRFLLWFVPQDPHAWFCNESVSEALGIEQGWRLGPNGFYSVLKALEQEWKSVR